MPVVVGSQDIHLGALLGSGHFGQVVRGTVRPYGNVAVKVIDRPPWLALWPGWRDHLFAEADNLHAAEHPHVVRFLACAYDTAQDRVFIVTELCSQGSAADLAGGNPLPLARCRSVARDALMGVEALHQRGMIHRDIKPKNILVDAAGRARIADFGLVTDQLTAGYGSYNGYYPHMAPEMHLSRVTSSKTDVWAMAMTIYRLLVGDAWYGECMAACGIDLARGATATAVIGAGGFAQKLWWMPHIPDRWRRFIREGLRDDPADRFQSATAMLASMNSLPAAPSWDCAVDADRIRWSSQVGSRTIFVEWEGRTTRRHRVRKWSEAAGGLRPYTFGDDSFTRWEDARRQAELFLGTRTT